jgi:hypothetical protein
MPFKGTFSPLQTASQVDLETEDYFSFIDTPAELHLDLFSFRRAAFYSGLQSKVGLIVLKTAVPRVTVNTGICQIASPVASRQTSFSYASSPPRGQSMLAGFHES